MFRKAWLTAAITGGIGLLLAIGLQIVAGVQYRIAEEQGKDSGYSPAWVVAGTYTGLILVLAGLVFLLVAGVLGILAHRRRSGLRS